MSNHCSQLVSAVSRAARYAAICLLCLAGLPSVAPAQTPQCVINLTWDVHPDWATLAFFDLEYGVMPGSLDTVIRLPARINEPAAPSPQKYATVSIPQPTTPKVYYFALRAVDTEGMRSGVSNTVSKLFEPTCGGTTTTIRIPTRISGVVAVVVISG